MDQFETRGWVRIPGAFTADEAAAMRDVVWRALEAAGIRRHKPATWTNEFPSRLQDLKKRPPFKAVGSERTLAAIGAVLGDQPWTPPRDWGAFFVLFPTSRPWFVPHASWHIDHAYTGSLTPPPGVKVHAMFGDVEPRAGGMTIVAGSHRLVHRWFTEHPPREGTKAAQQRRSLIAGVPYLRDLSTPDGDLDARIARFVDRVEAVEGIPLQVVENTATAGDVILMHPLVLHTRPTNAGTTPRFLLNKDIYL